MIKLKEEIFISYKKFFIISFFIISIFIKSSFAENLNEIKVGILLGFTGVVESVTPSMAESVELAFDEILKDEKLSKELNFNLQRADSTCSNIKSAKETATNIINDGVKFIIGAACPNVTFEVAKEITVPKKILMISPSDSSDELTKLKDNGFFFRTTPTKLRGSQILADITSDRGIRSVAISYSANKNYEKFAKSYSENLSKKNIKTSIIISHNKNINDYSKHISALKAAGGDALAIISSVNLGGDQIIESIIDTGMFDIFILSENMIDEEIVKNLKKDNLKKSFGYLPGLSSIGSDKFINLAEQSGIDPISPYTSESYDAAALIILSNFKKLYSNEVSIENSLYSVANKPGVKIYPGEIKKGIEILSKGNSINYEGATGVEFDKFGDTFGTFLEVYFKNKKLKTKKVR
ncbi:ABC transporter substrate-binding protein [Candidatus Pelagibacter sp.]|nr:ABC transporter substrate-binding protein [Candidatus Pelagibacter sp.]